MSWPSGERYKGDFYHVVGAIHNPSSVSVRLGEDKIEVTFYDASSSIIDADFVLEKKFAEEEIIPPGGKWPFRLILLDEDASQRVASYELLARGYETAEIPGQAEVISYGLFQNANLTLVGEVKNTTSDNANVRLIAMFYDEKDTVLAVGEFFAALALRPGETGPFWLLPVPTEAPGEVERCELITRCEKTNIVLYREFEVLNVVFQEGPDWKWDAIIGEVRNIGQQSATSIWVYATFYDAEGKVIDYSLSSVEPETLGPGEIGSFELIAPSPPWQMPDYTILVDGTTS